MDKSEFCVGIDVGKDELYASMSKLKVKSVKNTLSGVRSLVTWVRKVS